MKVTKVYKKNVYYIRQVKAYKWTDFFKRRWFEYKTENSFEQKLHYPILYILFFANLNDWNFLMRFLMKTRWICVFFIFFGVSFSLFFSSSLFDGL